MAACGYAPLHGHGGAASERFHVHLDVSKVPDAVASDDVLVGAREELARFGALASGQGYPRVEIEVLRADEASEGIAAVRDAEGRLRPQSRAARTGIVVRAWLARTPGAARERDTGDLRVVESASVASDAREAALRSSDALRGVARRAGQRLAARILGFPSPSDD